jgi:hypothetical protein
VGHCDGDSALICSAMWNKWYLKRCGYVYMLYIAMVTVIYCEQQKSEKKEVLL